MIRYFIHNGIGVAVLALALLLFGVLALYRLPIQLTPDVTAPQITVTTLYPGATPQDIEQEILIEQEKYLKSLQGLKKMTSTASMGQAEVILEFGLDTSEQENLIRVNNALAQVSNYPENVEEPSIRTASADEMPIAWMSVRARAETADTVAVSDKFDFVEDHVKTRFERIPGVASVRGVFGGSPREMQVMLDPVKLADRGISISKVREAIRARNRDVSGGDMDEGKRRFNVRTLGRYNSAEEIENTNIDEQQGSPIYLRDVGYARLGHAEQRTVIRHNGRRALALGVQRERGSNLLVVMDRVRATIRELNEGVLKEQGLYITQATDDTKYVKDAVRMVRANLLMGGLLAIATLLLFLRHARSTLILALAIPLCVVGSFFVIRATGRSINVISLAGLAFSIGVVLDASIVVLENIYRHKSMGKDPYRAAQDGTHEVWTAILSSALTNVVVFGPILFLKDEAGQIFRDLAIAIISANVLALVVSILIIPPMAARLLTTVPRLDERGLRGMFHRLFGIVPLAERLHNSVGRSFLQWMMGGILRRVVLVALVFGLAGVLIFRFMPKTEYLPEGNQESVRALLIPPQGYSLKEMTAIGVELEKLVKPAVEGTAEAFRRGDFAIPPLKSFFFVAFGNNMFIFTQPKDSRQASAVPEALGKYLQKIPGVISIASQASIFGGDITGSRSIDLEITGTDVKTLTGVAREAFFKVYDALPGAQARPLPGIEIGQPQISIIPDWDRAAELGISAQALGYGAWVLGDGAYCDDYYQDGDKMDLYMYSTMGAIDTLANFDSFRIATNEGYTVPLSDVAKVKFTYGPQEIRRVDNERAVTLEIVPPRSLSLEESIDAVQTGVIAPLKAEGTLPAGTSIRIGGTSDKLAEIRKELGADFILALILAYLTMVLVFKHWGHPITVMLSVPIGLTGGVLGLVALNRYLAVVSPGTIQSLDVLTMLGFVILLGSVINNPILIVQQAVNFQKEGQETKDAIVESTLSRVRPIMMTTGTTIFGLLPLVVNPGAGSELYRGLGVVMFGGLLLGAFVSTVFIPALMSLFTDAHSLLAGIISSKRAKRALPEPRPSERDKKPSSSEITIPGK